MVSQHFLPSQFLVLKILERADAFEWSWQGFGMFRLYLSKDVRMHVWAPATAVPDVTTIHTHPWHFESKVIIGAMTDRLYRIAPSFPVKAPTHHEQRIRCGPGGCATNEPPRAVRLYSAGDQRLLAGESYSMRADELHESVPDPGTVTIIRREFLADTEHAFVYHQFGTPWVSAEPREATTDEVTAMATLALDMARRP